MMVVPAQLVMTTALFRRLMLMLVLLLVLLVLLLQWAAFG